MTSRTSAITKLARPVSADRLRAFSLLEILVVVAIIGVLAALLMPTLGRARRAAARVATGNDLQAIATALEAYKQDFGDYPRVKLNPTPFTRADYSVARSSNDLKQRPNPQTGAELLCFALMGPAGGTEPTPPPIAVGFYPKQDGLDGPGFRARRQVSGPGPDNTLGTADDVLQGKVYSAYLSPDRFKMAAHEEAELKASDSEAAMVMHFNLLDRNDMPILYFPASLTKPNVAKTGALSVPAAAMVRPAYVSSDLAEPAYAPSSEFCRYDADDNLVWFFDDPYEVMEPTSGYTKFIMPPNLQKALKRVRAMLGDRHNTAIAPTGAPFTPDGVLESYETGADMPFLLWSAGPDSRFGPGPDQFSTGGNLTADDVRAIEKCDDVTNFRP